jgi:tRNA threonylcarbamoyladenosine biosynthesis protein TsaE
VSVRVSCPEEGDTRAIGRRLAALLRVGDIVLLSGGLGAGKTVLVSGIAEGLGVDETVLSPSFVLARRYHGLMELVHADLYRLESTGEIEDLDLPTEAADGVLAVEWGDVSEQVFGGDHLLIRIEAGDDGVRTVSLEPHGSWAGRPLDEVVA